jgi:hypothetical protein
MMGRRARFTNTPECYENMYSMMRNYCLPHEGEPAISLEMVDSYMYQKDDSEKFMRMFEFISYGLQAQECGIAAYESQVQDFN